MRYALSASAAAHVMLAGMGYLFFSWPAPPEAVTLDSVAVSLISISSVSANTTSMIESHAIADTVSAGENVLKPVDSDVLKPVDFAEVEPDPSPTREPLKPDPGEPLRAKPAVRAVETIVAEALKAESMEPLPVAARTPDPLQAVQSAPVEPRKLVSEKTAAIKPLETDPLEAIAGEQVNVAPVPLTRTIEQRQAPASPPQKAREKTDQPEKIVREAKANPGNGGNSTADARSAGASSSASVANYPGKVQSKLRRALRLPSGARNASGEAHVSFVVSISGAASDIHVVKSSGNAALDAASIDTVRRASPFPPIPPEAGRSTWNFTVPLAFRR